MFTLPIICWILFLSYFIYWLIKKNSYQKISLFKIENKFIDKRTGALTIDKDFTLSASTTLNGIASYFGTSLENYYGHNRVRNFKWHDKYFIFYFYFENSKLKSLSFIFNDKPYSDDPSWDDWSYEKEMKDLNRYKLWLNTELGSSRNFVWGSIDASYDNKSSGSRIILRYN